MLYKNIELCIIAPTFQVTDEKLLCALSADSAVKSGQLT